MRSEFALPVRRARAAHAPDVRRAARAAVHCQRAAQRRHPLQSVRHLAVPPNSHEFTSQAFARVHQCTYGALRSIFTAPKHEPRIRYIGRGFQMTTILAFVLVEELVLLCWLVLVPSEPLELTWPKEFKFEVVRVSCPVLLEELMLKTRTAAAQTARVGVRERGRHVPGGLPAAVRAVRAVHRVLVPDPQGARRLQRGAQPRFASPVLPCRCHPPHCRVHLIASPRLAGFVIQLGAVLDLLAILAIVLDTPYTIKMCALAAVSALKGLSLQFGLFLQKLYVVRVDCLLRLLLRLLSAPHLLLGRALASEGALHAGEEHARGSPPAQAHHHRLHVPRLGRHQRRRRRPLAHRCSAPAAVRPQEQLARSSTRCKCTFGAAPVSTRHAVGGRNGAANELCERVDRRVRRARTAHSRRAAPVLTGGSRRHHLQHRGFAAARQSGRNVLRQEQLAASTNSSYSYIAPHFIAFAKNEQNSAICCAFCLCV